MPSCFLYVWLLPGCCRLLCHCVWELVQLHGMDAALYRSQVERAHLDQVAAGKEAEVDLDHLSSTVGLVYYAIGVGVSVALAASPAMFKRSARAYSTTMKTVFLQPGENVKHKPQMAIPRPSPLVAWRRLCFSTFADVRSCSPGVALEWQDCLLVTRLCRLLRPQDAPGTRIS